MYERTPDRLVQLARELNCVNNFAFLPHRRLIPWVPGSSKGQAITVDGQMFEATKQLTLCNCYLSVITAALGCAIPPMKANDQISKYLDANEGKMAGWMKVIRSEAIARAKLGYPTVMGTVVTGGNGHVGLVMPSPVTDPNTVYISAAGASNIVFDKATKSFGVALAEKASFWTHN